MPEKQSTRKTSPRRAAGAKSAAEKPAGAKSASGKSAGRRTAAAPRKRAARQGTGAAGAAGPRYVYAFGGGQADGDRSMRDLLGGKGANLAEMTRAGLPVPPGFTISTEACTVYYEQRRRVPAAIDTEMDRHVAELEKLTGLKLGSAEQPLLVSVRSGPSSRCPG